jgi:hypothetical protein
MKTAPKETIETLTEKLKQAKRNLAYFLKIRDEMCEKDLSEYEPTEEIEKFSLERKKFIKSIVNEIIDERYKSSIQEEQKELDVLRLFLYFSPPSPTIIDENETVIESIEKLIRLSMLVLVTENAEKERRKKEFEFIQVLLELNFLPYDKLSDLFVSYQGSKQITSTFYEGLPEEKKPAFFSSPSDDFMSNNELSKKNLLESLLDDRKPQEKNSALFSSTSDDFMSRNDETFGNSPQESFFFSRDEKPKKTVDYWPLLCAIMEEQLKIAPGAPVEEKTSTFIPVYK